MIKVILWDIDNTLLNFDAQEKNALIKCFNLFNLGEISQRMIVRYNQINISFWEKLERKEISRDELLVKRFDDFFKEFNINCNSEKFNKAYQEELGETIVFNDNSYEIIKKLQSKVKQYAVTNGSLIAQKKKLHKSGLINLFDGVFISEIIHFDKPNIEFFNYVFSKIEKFNRSEILIVGDSLTSDMQGGINAKIKTCWYNPNMKVTNLEIDYQIKNLQEIYNLLDN